MDRREYEERYGEHVGTCSIHGTVLGSCSACEQDEGCEGNPDWRSQCCDAPPFYADGYIEDIDYSTLPTPSGFCRQCKDKTLFEDARYD